MSKPGYNGFLIPECYNEFCNRERLPYLGDDRLRRERLVPECEPSGAELVKSAQNSSANRTSYAAMPLAA